MRFMLGVAKLWIMQKLLLGGIAHMAAFVPSMLLVLPQLAKLGRTRIKNGRRKWCRGNFHHVTLLFPLDGLSTKVLGDRIAELLEFNQMMTPESFLSRFFPIPIVPRVGGAAKMVSCLHHRSMILGSDLAPVKHPVQYVHAIERKLTKHYRKVARAVGEPEVPLKRDACRKSGRPCRKPDNCSRNGSNTSYNYAQSPKFSGNFGQNPESFRKFGDLGIS